MKIRGENPIAKKIIDIEDFDIKYKETINLIQLNASVKIIVNNKNEDQIIDWEISQI